MPNRQILLLVLSVLLISVGIADQVAVPVATNTTFRVMAANLNGDVQSYQDFALRIFQGLKPDVVMINEFNYGAKTPADFRTMINTAFGTNFNYYRESGYNIPNGIISRWPILASGSWDDPQLNDRGFAWAQLDIPGPNDLYVVCVHLHSSGGAASRTIEAGVIKTNVLGKFPAGAYVAVAGDFNLDNRSEATLTAFKTFLKDDPIPTDQAGDPDTNNSRAKPYDLILTSDTFRTNFVPVKIGDQSFANGLVFDSRVFTPLTAVAPVQKADSGLAQHMGVIKDFRVSYMVTNFVTVEPPTIALENSRILHWTGPSNLTWTVQSGNTPLNLLTLGKASSTTTSYAFTNSSVPDGTLFYRVRYP
ncbi:MAG TPA: endonuclease/exonuclease/phosphatase family protein [Candidatus Limnocylindria bacterium]|nr:endonuclease/exonuclease/phosphatase family protein [Candidatus Limnocylindria bacterium]